MTAKTEELHDLFKVLMKLNVNWRNGNPRKVKFQEELWQTIPFWPKSALKDMEASKNRRAKREQDIIDGDIILLKNMMYIRVVFYIIFSDFTSLVDTVATSL